MNLRLSNHARGQIEWLEFGDQNSDQLVVICHAAATGAQAYHRLAALLSADNRRVVVPNLCGYGETNLDFLGDEFTVKDHHSVVEYFCETLPWSQLHLVGHSMGGLLAFQLADRMKADSLTLVEPMIFSVLDVKEDEAAIKLDQELVGAFIRLHEAGQSEEGIKIFIEAWNGVHWHEMPESLRQRIVDLTPQLYRETQAVTFDQRRKPMDWPTCPIHLMEGGETLLPAQAIIKRLREHHPEAKHSLLENDGHMGPLFNSDAFAEEITAFWEALGRPAQTPK